MFIAEDWRGRPVELPSVREAAVFALTPRMDETPEDANRRHREIISRLMQRLYDYDLLHNEDIVYVLGSEVQHVQEP